MHYWNCGVSWLQVKLSQWVYKTSDGMMQTVLLALFLGPFPASFAYSTNNLVQIFMLENVLIVYGRTGTLKNSKKSEDTR